MNAQSNNHPIGKSVPRKEGRKKVTGAALYVDDISFPEMLYGATVRSSVPRGRIKKISFEGDIPWDEFTIVTAKDIPGENYVALILNDQPYLVQEVVNHSEEPIVLLAHPNKYLLEEARRQVRLDIEELPAIFTLEDSVNKEQIIWGDDNVFKSFLVDKGNVDDVWAQADFIVEGEYQTGAQEQLYIENNGVIAIANEREGVTVWGSMQCPYYVHKALIKLFELPEEKIRVIQTETGGGFGGKEEYPSMIAGHAALLSWKSGKPVKIIYDAPQDSGDERRKVARDGDRIHRRRRRLLHALAGRAFARHDPRRRSLQLSKRAYSLERSRFKRSSAWCVQGIWCAAEYLCSRTPDG
jgi:CO/xanthine dehydrogenase Mo-binding subunit